MVEWESLSYLENTDLNEVDEMKATGNQQEEEIGSAAVEKTLSTLVSGGTRKTYFSNSMIRKQGNCLGTSHQAWEMLDNDFSSFFSKKKPVWQDKEEKFEGASKETEN